MSLAHKSEQYFKAVIAQKELVITEKETQLQEHKTQLQEHKTQLQSQQNRIELLEEQIKLLIIQRYVRASEKYANPNDLQGQLFDEAELESCSSQMELEPEEAKERSVAEHKRKTKRGKRAPLPSCLERIRVEHTLPDSELTGPNGELFSKIGEVISEQLDIIPAQVRVIQNVRFQYAVKGREELGIKTASLPVQPLPKSIATPGLLAHVVIGKFQHHLPLYRQSQIWRSMDVKINRSTLCNWVLKAGDLVAPLLEDLFEELCQHKHIHVDETPVNILSSSHKPKIAGCHKGWMWVYTNHHGVIYEYQPSRSGSHPSAKLEEFEGYVQSDRYGGYEQVVDGKKRTGVACMAHARRKFTDTKKSAGKKKKHPIADRAIKGIAKLYHLEKQAKENLLSIEGTGLMRKTQAIPILKKIQSYLKEQQPKVPPQSLLGKAIAYFLNHYEALKRYTEHGTLAIDNNAAERAIRPFAIGRKNWMFCGNDRGAKASANLFSLIESAKLHRLNVFKYLTLVFTELPKAKTPKQREVLLPMFVARSHPEMLLK